jgi:hypothetical protein
MLIKKTFTVQLSSEEDSNGAVHHGIWGNCIAQDDTSLVRLWLLCSACPSLRKHKKQRGSKQMAWFWRYLFLNSLQNNLSEFKQRIFWIQKQLQAKEQCVYCNLFSSNMKIVCGDLLLNRKNRGGFTLPLEEFEKLWT